MGWVLVRFFVIYERLKRSLRFTTERMSLTLPRWGNRPSKWTGWYHFDLRNLATGYPCKDTSGIRQSEGKP